MSGLHRLLLRALCKSCMLHESVDKRASFAKAHMAHLIVGNRTWRRNSPIVGFLVLYDSCSISGEDLRLRFHVQGLAAELGYTFSADRPGKDVPLHRLFLPI